MSTPIETSKYRKLPVEIEAVQLSARNLHAVWEWCGGTYWSQPSLYAVSGLQITTPEGVMIARYGDWVVKGVAGEFYPVKDEIFRRTYQVSTANGRMDDPRQVANRIVADFGAQTFSDSRAAEQYLANLILAQLLRIEELHVLQLAAISTACTQNTEKTVKDRIGRENPYWTVAYADVCRSVDREMDLRNALEIANRSADDQMRQKRELQATLAKPEKFPRGTDWEKDGIGISEEGHIILKFAPQPGQPEFADCYGFTPDGLHKTLRDHFQAQAEHEKLKRRAEAAEPAPKLLSIAKDLDAKAKEAASMADGSAAGHVMSGQRQAYRDAAATIRAEFSIP